MLDSITCSNTGIMGIQKEGWGRGREREKKVLRL